jgi:hypothetical protein
MRSVFGWIFSHKLVTLLLILIAFLMVKNFRNNPYPMPLLTTSHSNYDMSLSAERSAKVGAAPGDSYAPFPDAPRRMVVQNSFMSLLVNNVSESIQQIQRHVEQVGGYMVHTDISNPSDAASGSITVRIPQEKLPTALAQFRTLAVKVVSENLQGTDVTDEYEDVDEKLRILERNKARLEEIMDRAVEISDITNIQQQLFNIQAQIDSLKGRQNYLEKTAAMSSVTVYLSTDELALPYAPETPWRPALVYKYAIRSLLTNFQEFGSFLIWVGVYSVVWIPALIILILLSRWMKKRV